MVERRRVARRGLTTGSESAKWLIRPAPLRAPRARLICCPYAGAAASLFRSWPPLLPEGVELIAIELPGRARRISEDPPRSIREIVRAMSEALTSVLDRPFAIYGHSMGALLGFELARAFARSGLCAPLRLFASGYCAPRIRIGGLPSTSMTDEQFTDELRRLNGTPPSVLEHPELMGLVLPTLRADFALVAQYRYQNAPRLGCPITVMGGTEDPEVTENDLRAWSQETNAGCDVVMLPGDHFFLHDYEQDVLRIVSDGLEHDLAASRP